MKGFHTVSRGTIASLLGFFLFSWADLTDDPT